MAFDTYSPYPPRWLAILRALAASFRIGHFFGVEVRMYWAALIIMPLIGIYEFWMLLSPTLVLGSAAVVTIGLFLIIYTHEMGHIAAGWRYGIHTPLITLSPLGGVAHMAAPAPTHRAAAVIALAGPAVHLAWIAVFGPIYFLVADQLPLGQTWGWLVYLSLSFLWHANLSLMVFNLLPFFPMDGGRVLAALLTSRMHPNRARLIAARVGMVGAVLLGIAGLFGGEVWGGILLCIGISNFFACRQEMVAIRYQQTPYGGGDYLQPWQSNPDAWKSGGGGGGGGIATPEGWKVHRGGDSEEEEAEAEPQPGYFARRRQEKAEREERELAEELDRILAKISAEGMGALSRQERKTLERASKAARQRRSED